MLAELLVATALGAIGLATAMEVRKRLGQPGQSDLREAMRTQAKHLRRVMRLPSKGGERPRVVVQGPKIRPVVCQICLGRVKEGLEYAKCACGKDLQAYKKKGKYTCVCGQGCDCNCTSNQPGNCVCGKKMY